MTKSSLNSDQRRTVEVIEALRFGVIEHLVIRGGSPCCDQEPRIVQAIKLDSASEPRPDRSHADLTLKKEFDSLFNYLNQLRDGTVDVEVRHGLPVRLVVERRFGELLDNGGDTRAIKDARRDPSGAVHWSQIDTTDVSGAPSPNKPGEQR